jgi:hypothetical protein
MDVVINIIFSHTAEQAQKSGTAAATAAAAHA